MRLFFFEMKKRILNETDVHLLLHTLCCELLENHEDFSKTALIGLQPRGIYLSEQIAKRLKNEYKIKNLRYGTLDITFFRDDFRRREMPLKANKTQIPFLIEEQKVVLIDDVLFSGRSVNAALTAVQAYGRPKSIELMVLIDRRFSRELPLQPDYTGKKVDAIGGERVIVNWEATGQKNEVYITNNEKD